MMLGSKQFANAADIQKTVEGDLATVDSIVPAAHATMAMIRESCLEAPPMPPAVEALRHFQPPLELGPAGLLLQRALSGTGGLLPSLPASLHSSLSLLYDLKQEGKKPCHNGSSSQPHSPTFQEA